MKIAIIGAGLAGLSCALTLEKHGHSADVFEKHSDISFQYKLAELMTPILHRPIDDAVKFFSEKHDIHLKPTTNVQKIFVHSPSESAFVEGNLGFINMRGDHAEAYEKQIAEQLVNTKIHCNQNITYKEISKEYTHVVIATGDVLDTQQIQPIEISLASTFAGAIVQGDFIPNEVHTWFDNTLAPKGMVYFLPHSKNQGTLVLVYPQYEETLVKDKNKYWKEALVQASQTLKQNLIIEEEFSLKDYNVGKSKYPRIGNTFFVGNCMGAITPFLGFGQSSSMLSGIYAAYDICGLGDYEELSAPLYKDYEDSLTLRKAIERLSNDQLDLVAKSLHVKTIDNLITKPNMSILKVLSHLLNPFIR